ncbi:ankyrin repeat-containing protein [Toxoplasma gondii GAB2-2007-GAL-DOM2]|uniref:Ankyrin repeat-containing protein n=2 Tax=Toxoplasma gondii TaxID=5811 RepID=V4Z908_TOXGV|nr:ankyrin repeat-containing protein [Toxoplasma gondii VEG]KFG35415.1 ankyrin repeat-containing protein [Toxoplasma gondii GAB2-2007-GAL-DOM2]
MAAPAAFSAARRAKVEEMVDDFIYAARVGDAADLETTLAALKAEFEEPHSLCRFLAETGNREKKAKRNDSQAPACSCGHDGSNARVVDLQDPVTGQTALHMAAANGEEEIAKFLIQKGARHLANNMGNTPLHWAVTNQKLAIVKLLLDSSSPPSDSASASSSGASSSGASSSAASSGASSSGASSSGASSSGAAASPPSAGAFVVDVLAQNKVGKSAISEGFNAGNMEILQLLLEHYSAKALEETYQPASQSREDAGEALSEASSVGAAVPGTPSRPTLTERSPGSADACAAASCLVQEVTHAIQLGAPTARQRRPEAPADNARKATENARKATENGEKVPRTKGEEGTGEEDEESVIIKCREIGLDWTGQAFGDNAATDDTTGLHLWSAAVIGAQWMAELSKKGRFAGASVLELGAGCGLMGLAAALHAPEALSVFVQSDVFPHTLRNLEKGLSANGFSRGKGDTWTKAGRAQRACILALDWTEKRTWPRVAEGSPKREAFERDGEEKETLQQFDFILGSDLLYDRKMLPPLVEVVASLLKKPAGTFYYVHRLHRQGAGEFVDALRRRGLKCEERSPPEEYFSNPFVDKTNAEAELHLPEFSSRDFVMVRCAWR